MATRFFINSTNTFTTPPSLGFVIFHVWGGGGAGGSATGNPSGGGGGAGGQYANKYSQAPDATYTIVAGQSAIASLTLTVNGQDSTVTGSVAGLIAVAKGGAGAAPATANSQVTAGGTGSTTSGVGDLVVAGGNGAAATTGTGGGGGGSGPGWDGIAANDASGRTPGGNIPSNPALTQQPGGGGGGAGALTTGNTGGVGSVSGGGGGGAYANNAADRSGGNGAQGTVMVVFHTPSGGFLLGCN